MHVRPIVAWWDCWIGLYFDRAHRRLYVMVPFCGVCIEFGGNDA